jgi:membrane protease YdiL (CAAX protease family)
MNGLQHEAAALALGAVGIVWIGWWKIRHLDTSIWRAMPLIYGILGAAALVWGDVTWWGPPEIAAGADIGRSGPVAAATGLILGVGLYLATRVGSAVLVRWGRFAADTAATYRWERGRTVTAMLMLSAVSAVGEELFWRGLVQPAAIAERPLGVAIVAVWAAYVATVLPSRNVAIGAGAVVGGGVWGVLAAASGGVLAPLACHLTWTWAMIVRPPSVDRT